MTLRANCLGLLLCHCLLPAQRALLDQLPPDGDAYAMRARGAFPDFVAVELPGEGPIQGLARVGTLLWIARGADLLAVQWPGLQLQTKVPAPAKVLALAADDRWLYARRSADILVIDAAAGRVVRELPLSMGGDNALAMAHHEGALVVAGDAGIEAVDPRTGKTRREAMPGGRDPVHWLASDGASVWAGGADDCRRFLPGKNPRWFRECVWPSRLATSAATWIDGRLLLAGEQPDQKGELVTCCRLLNPRRTLSEEVLLLQLQVAGDGVKYELGPKTIDSATKLTAELARIGRDPSAQVPWPDGTVRLLAVVIEPHPGVRMRDVCSAWDVVAAAGYEVHCPAQEEWVKQYAPTKTGASQSK